MADRRLIATDITDSGQVEQVARGTMARYNDRAVAFIATTLWSWMIAHIDDDGRMIGKPAAIRSKIFARYMDLVTEDEVAEVVAWMNDVDLLVWYEVRGSPSERYLYSPRFTVHQTLRGDRYGPSRHPAPPSWKPEDGHPYSKRPELAKEKPQRDTRPTVRVAKRPVNRPPRGLWETDVQPQRDQDATMAQPERDHSAPDAQPDGPQAVAERLRSGDGTYLSQRTSPNVPRLSAEPRPTAPLSKGSGELRSGTKATGSRALTPEQLREQNEAKAEQIVEAASGPWRMVLDALREVARDEHQLSGFVTWYVGTQLETRDEIFYVVAPNAFARDWLRRSEYVSAMRAAIGAISGTMGPDVRVVLEDELPAEVSS